MRVWVLVQAWQFTSFSRKPRLRMLRGTPSPHGINISGWSFLSENPAFLAILGSLGGKKRHFIFSGTFVRCVGSQLKLMNFSCQKELGSKFGHVLPKCVNEVNL